MLTGTFDPVHLGHTAMAGAALATFKLDQIWLWINAEAAHKAGVTPFADRLAMARLAVAGSERLSVYEGELSRHPHNNVETFAGLARRHPESELYYIVGADTLATVDRWDDVETVVTQTTFLVAERGSVGAVRVADELRWRLGALGDRLRAEVFEFAGYDGASSLRVRAQLAAGEWPEALDERVYQYTLAHNLYRD